MLEGLKRALKCDSNNVDLQNDQNAITTKVSIFTSNRISIMSLLGFSNDVLVLLLKIILT